MQKLDEADALTALKAIDVCLDALREFHMPSDIVGCTLIEAVCVLVEVVRQTNTRLNGLENWQGCVVGRPAP